MQIANKFAEIIRNTESIEAIGIRGLYDDEDLGAMANSYIWDDGDRTDDELHGTCAVCVTREWIEERDYSDLDDDEIYANLAKMIDGAIAKASPYGNGRIGLVVGRDGGTGQDSSEIIIRDAKLIAIA